MSDEMTYFGEKRVKYSGSKLLQSDEERANNYLAKGKKSKYKVYLGGIVGQLTFFDRKNSL